MNKDSTNTRDGDVPQPEQPGQPRASWVRRILTEVRDDIAKDYLKEGIKLVLYSGMAFILGGGVWFGASQLRVRDNPAGDDDPAFSYLKPLIDEARRGDRYGVRWKIDGAVKPFLVYCEHFVSSSTDGAEQLEQFAAQFPGCPSTESEVIGDKTFVNLSPGSQLSDPTCLANANGQIVEQLQFYGCNDVVISTVKRNRLFLSDDAAQKV